MIEKKQVEFESVDKKFRSNHNFCNYDTTEQAWEKSSQECGQVESKCLPHTMKRRVRRFKEIDFVKCVMILLMVAFHLVFIGNTYVAAKAFVYTFHMPCFLIISGYLLKSERPYCSVVRNMLLIALPYSIVEVAYIAGATMLPIREHIEHISVPSFLNILLLHPIGPYWYLHTLVLCSLTCSCMRKGGLIILSLLVYMKLVALSSCMYFLIGVALRQIGFRFRWYFRGSWLSFLALATLACVINKPDRFSFLGILIVYTAISSAVKLNDLIERYAPKIYNICLFIGRNTLVILLFSPVFTIFAKFYQPVLLYIDRFGVLFMVISVILAVAGSIAIAWCLDKISLSQYIFGRRRIVKV